MHPTTILYLALTLLTLQILYTLITAIISPLRSIPGPFLTRFSKAWYFFSVKTGQHEHHALALHREYAKPNEHFAPIVRLAPNMYSIKTPEKVIYGISTGTEVGINTWLAHYDEDVWGPDAQQFRPERWIETSPERLKVMESHFLPFGVGSRTCIGRHIGHLEMSKLLPQIVHKFDFSLERPNQKWKTQNMWLQKSFKGSSYDPRGSSKPTQPPFHDPQSY
ncbi:hypothetical protein GRF29_44g260760 [Pseudopithomyces chartarum]|uniref:Cytochrome P450 n=1 Tax=Pseudopithomyces chartarum TaxID=1892770 RepID=A0AAN6RIV4_9PLEO|nr:hypothetical protein GRF29_44g260760 [Pseudopithomyces chartarum]